MPTGAGNTHIPALKDGVIEIADQVYELFMLGESLTKTPYMQNNYKTFQYIHWQRKFGEFGASVLFLNDGMPYINPDDTTGAGVAKENVAYSQTIGPRVTYKKINFQLC